MANIRTVYDTHRLHYSVMDSIRFTASELGVSALDVALELGLSNYFISHR
jgi:hypothetical protein